MTVFDDVDPLFVDPAIGLGEEIVYQAAGTGGPQTITGVWSELGIIDGMAPGADTLSEAVCILQSDAPALAPGDSITRSKNGKVYRVATPITPDGFGLVTVTLEDAE